MIVTVPKSSVELATIGVVKTVVETGTSDAVVERKLAGQLVTVGWQLVTVTATVS